MRVFVVVLLVANLLVAVLNYFAASKVAKTTPPQDLNPERIRVLGPVSESTSAPPAPRTPPPAATPSAPAPAAPAAAAPAACLAWGVFTEERAPKAREALTALNLGSALTEQTLALAPKYWVYLPAGEASIDPDQRLIDIKKRKVGEVTLLREEGKWHNAISFGVFSSQQAAAKRREELAAKGVTGAKIEARGEARKHTLFLVRDPSDELTARVTSLSAQFPGSELQAIPCPQQPS